MALSLAAEAKADSYRLEAYEIVASTNDLAAEFAKSGDKGRLWIVAAAQTGGRGRRGRVWQSPQGNLYASLLLCEGLTAEQIAMLGFVAGLALYDALRATLPAAAQQSHKIKLKWPNDVLADGAKLAGILPELIHMPAQGQPAAVIGIGVNIIAAPARKPEAAGGAPIYEITDLCSLGAVGGAEAARDRLFAALSRSWVENYALWDKGCGMAAVREKWLRHAAYQGEEMRLKRNGQFFSGIFETIDAAGRLVLRQENGARQFISAGDVYFGAVASAAAQEE